MELGEYVLPRRILESNQDVTSANAMRRILAKVRCTADILRKSHGSGRPLWLALRRGGPKSNSQENNGEKSSYCEVRDGQFRGKSIHVIPPLAYSPGCCVQSGMLERGGRLFLTQQGARTQNEQG